MGGDEEVVSSAFFPQEMEPSFPSLWTSQAFPALYFCFSRAYVLRRSRYEMFGMEDAGGWLKSVEFGWMQS